MPRNSRGEDHEITHEHTLEPGLTCLVFIGDRSCAVQLPAMGTVIIGRGSDAELNVAAEGVSRKHARLELARGAATLHDLGSRNGTYVNDERVREPRPVGHGDEVRVGEARIVLSRRSAAQDGARAVLLHGAFAGRLRIEVARSLGFGRPISLLLVRLPGRWFELNVARVVGAALRPVDVSGLYDDATLEIIVPEAGEDAVRQLEATLLESLSDAGVEARTGSATLLGRGGSAEELHERAMKALRVALGEEDPPGTVKSVPVVFDPVMERIHAQIRRIAPGSISVLVVGETGVGKEVIARAIHAASRRSGALVCVNTAALPESLLESELFGHERGAFTGATQAKAGLFEAADKGTLFLDEIGELHITMQAKLLRVLDDQTVRRVGSATDRTVDVRVVAATNCDLEQRVREKAFRRDLLFRLNACTIVVPPLRDRPSEIAQLAEFFLARAGSARGRRLSLAPETLARLEAHAWPGNVRELRNVIERAVALCEGSGGVIQPEHLPDTLHAAAASTIAFTDSAPAGSSGVRDSMKDYERERIVEALQRAGGNQTRAAELLGLPRKTLSYRIERLGIRRPPRG